MKIMSSLPFCTGRPPGPEMENAVNRESYSLAAGLALGLVMLEVPQCIVISKLRVRNVQGPVSRKSCNSSDIIVFVSLKRRRLEARNFSSCFNFYSPYNISKTQLYRISRLEFYEWLFGSEKFSGLSRNGLQDGTR